MNTGCSQVVSDCSGTGADGPQRPDGFGRALATYGQPGAHACQRSDDFFFPPLKKDLFFHSSGGYSSEIEVSAGLVSSEVSLLGS